MTQRVSLGGGFEKHLSPEDFYLYVTSHEYKHYSAGGTGLRSVLDTYVYLQKAAPDMDYVTAEAEKLGMAEFEAANRSLAMHLFSGAALTEADKEMLNYILDSGVYGTLNHQVENAMSRHGWGKIQYALHFFGSEALFSSRTDELSILLRIWYDMGIGRERENRAF